MSADQVGEWLEMLRVIELDIHRCQTAEVSEAPAIDLAESLRALRRSLQEARIDALRAEIKS